MWNLLGPTGEVVGRIEAGGEPGGARRYYYKDALGSVRAVADAAGVVVESRDYSPWGLEMAGRVYVSGSKGEEGFTGHELPISAERRRGEKNQLDPSALLALYLKQAALAACGWMQCSRVRFHSRHINTP